MRNLISIVTVIFGLTLTLFAQAPKQAPALPSYSVYGWRNKGGDWNFSLMSDYLSRNFWKSEVMSKKVSVKGLERFKLKISGLPAGTHLHFSDGVVNQTGKLEHLGFPPQSVLKELRDFGATRQVVIEWYGLAAPAPIPRDPGPPLGQTVGPGEAPCDCLPACVIAAGDAWKLAHTAINGVLNRVSNPTDGFFASLPLAHAAWRTQASGQSLPVFALENHGLSHLHPS